MAEENTSEVKEIENSCDKNTPEMSEEGSVERVHVTDVGNAEDVTSVVSNDQEEIIIPVINEVRKPQGVTPRRYSTGTIGTRPSKPQVQSRYRGNHRVSSIHDLCKHGKRCDHQDDAAVKPWKMVRRKSVEGSDVIKVETSSLTRKSLGSVSKQIPGTKPESSVAAKRDTLALDVKIKPNASVNSDSSSELARSVGGSSVKSSDRARRNKETECTLSGGSSSVVKKVPGLRSVKSNAAMGKVSKVSGAGSSKVSAPKNMEKAKSETINSEDVKEKTVCVVESSVKGVQSEKKEPSEKKTIRTGHKSLTTPKRVSSPTKQIPGKISTGLMTKKKETGSADLEANPKTEKKIIRPKKTGVKVSLAQQLTFKKGKVLDPKPEDSSPKWIKFRKRVVQELKTQTEGKKKSLKDRRLGVETKNDSCESSKREKVVLRHQKVEGKKKMVTLLNSVIEETFIKLTKVRKNKVKALIGAFETVISLQDTHKTSHKSSQSKATTSASKVRPLVSEE
ncbi:PREDICTED: uncharacterized protein LOC104738629 [Camelina sativa]|uniref:Uncharacterized protein LOC104738629 n=1 Tax=Camelina sativa TaxID=90675 RepID=A0ABM0VJB8_CAMSA|nr:PREDICTED: uncharacterized protein LOC104738629 [Camelina sativa]XP_010457109.1 PREDICTED: uncharacterized protein LOC104738629 [Camelina sativa]